MPGFLLSWARRVGCRWVISLLRQLPPGPLPPSWGRWAPYNGVEIPPSQALFLISLQPRSSLVRAVLFPHFTDGERETQVARGAQENTVLVTEAGFHPKQGLSPLRSAPALAPAGSREAASEACSVSEPRGAPPASLWRGVGAPGWRALWGRVWAFPLGCEGRGVCFGVIPLTEDTPSGRARCIQWSLRGRNRLPGRGP